MALPRHLVYHSIVVRKVVRNLRSPNNSLRMIRRRHLSRVCMLRSVSKFTVTVQVEDLTVDAILDSAAEVTIISDRVNESMSASPEKLYDVRLDTAGRQLSLRGFVAGPMKLKIGRSCP